MTMQPQPAMPVQYRPPRREFNTLEERYQTVWPVMVTTVSWRWTSDMFKGLYKSMPGAPWLKGTLAGLIGLVAGAGLLALYLAVISLTVLWPIGLLWMLPVRIAVGRNSGQYSAIYACSLFGIVTGGITWIVGMILACRDKPQPVVMYPPPPPYGHGGGYPVMPPQPPYAPVPQHEQLPPPPGYGYGPS
jgi:hypothetical protein